MKIQELLIYGYKFLGNTIDCELILSHILKRERLDLLINPSDIISKEEIALYKNLLNKRKGNQPIAQIICKKEFWNHEYVVNNNILIPRPDSESLIEIALELFPNKKQFLKILELGTGSGCLIISLLSEYKNAIGIGIDKSIDAYKATKHNAKLHKINNRLTINRKSWNEFYTNTKFDIIISNPPYIKRMDINHLEKDVRIHEPLLALNGGIHGISKYLEILPIIAKNLKKYAILEISDHHQLNLLKKYIIYYNFRIVKIIRDLSHSVRGIVLSKC